MTERIKECVSLAEEILKNFELSELPIGNIILKGVRLCRLINDEDGFLLFTYESSGYPQTEDGFMTKDAWRISKLAGRRYYKKEEKNGKETNKEYAFTAILSSMEQEVESSKLRLKVANDPNVSISSANPRQYVSGGYTNRGERNSIVNDISENVTRINKVKGCLYAYVLNIRNNLVYGNIVEDVFTRFRGIADRKLQSICPESIKKFMSAYENLQSDNSEDWANAVHSCRRVLKDLADNLYPPTEDKQVKGKTIKLGEEQYINRLIQFIDDNSSSKAYKAIVGTSLASIGERIDAVYNSSNKGTHADVTKSEAERYIIYTYMLVGDILTLQEENDESNDTEEN